MKKIFSIAALCFCTFAASASAERIVDVQPEDFSSSVQSRPGHLLVGFSKEASGSTISAVLEEADVRSVRTLGAIDTRLVRIEDTTRAEAVSELRAAGAVEYVEPDYLLSGTAIPSDSFFGDLWGMHNTGQTILNFTGTTDADIDAPAAWDTETGLDGGVTVAVADTGIDLQHGDLSSNLWSNPDEIPGNGVDDDGNGKTDDVRGWNWVGVDNNNPDDDQYHGTHVAGTIAARGNNNKGVAGVSWGARLAALKVLDSGGSGFTSDVAASALYAGQEDIPIYNASLGGGAYSQTFYNALFASSSQGTLYVFAAGNQGSNIETTKYYPCSYNLPNVLCVGSTDAKDQLSSFSNYGATEVDLAAPGSTVLSTYPQNSSGTDLYAYLSGTSMATPHVAGAAALLLATDPEASTYDLRRWIMEGTEPLPSLSGKMVSGGRLNVYDSLQMLLDENLEEPPALVIETPERDWIATSSPTWEFRSSRAESISCSLVQAGNASNWQSCSVPSFSASGLQHGASYRLDIRATNEWGETTRTRTFSVDTVVPARPTITSAPPALGRNRNVRFEMSGEGSIRFFCYLYDWEGWRECSGSYGADGTSYDNRNNLQDGTYTFRVRQEDWAGNRSPEATHTFEIDTTPPAAPGFISGPPSWSNSASASVQFSLPAGTTARCTFAGVEQQGCTSPWSRSGLAEGPHALQVRAEDAAGNISSNAMTVSWNVDTVAPSQPTVSGPNGQTAFENVSFSFSGEEAATFLCSLDSAEMEVCARDVSWENLAEGEHVLRVAQRDRAGNTSPTLERQFEVVGDGPELQLGSVPASPTSNQRPVFSWNISDPSLQTRCSISENEDLEFEFCSGTSEHQPLGNLADGNWVFRIRVSDEQGSWTEKRYDFRVDTTDPSLLLSALSGLRNSRSETITFSANEQVTFFCSLDGAEPSECQSPLQLQGLLDGPHSIRVEARDLAGNSQATERNWTIDATPPPAPTIAAGTPLRNPGAIAFSGEAGATFECSLGSEAWQSCTSPWSRSLPDGDYSLRLRSRDLAGNLSQTTLFSWSVGPAPIPRPTLRGPDALGRVWFEGAGPGQDYLCSWQGEAMKACASPFSVALWSSGRYEYRLQIREGARVGEIITGAISIGDSPVPPDASPSVRLLSSSGWTSDRRLQLWVSWPAGTRTLQIGDERRGVFSDHSFLLPSGQASGRVEVPVRALGLGDAELWRGSAAVLYDGTSPVLQWARARSLSKREFRLRFGGGDGHSGLLRAQWGPRRGVVSGGKVLRGQKVFRARGKMPVWMRVADRVGNWSDWTRVQR